MPARSNKASDLAAVTNANPVLDMDNVYLSDQGWAYRHYKREDKSLFWDEILVAGEVPASDTPDAFGAASPTFETGDGEQANIFDLAPANIVSFADPVVSTATTLGLVYDLDVTDATFAWSTDETGATFDDDTLAAPELTHAATPGNFTLTCVITSATAADSPVTVTFDYEVVFDLAPANIVSFADPVVSTATTLGLVYDLDVTDATFAWSTDETGATFDDDTLAAPELTHAATPGNFTLTCVITSATAADSPVTVTFDYEVVAA